MATYSAGTAFLTVVPSFRGVEKAMERQVREMAGKVDKDLAAAMSKGMREAAKQSKGVGKDAAGDFAGAYEREAKKHLNAAWRSLPEPQPGVDMRKWDKALAGVRKDMKELAGQRLGIDIDHDTFDEAVRQMGQRLKQLRDTAPATNVRGWYDADAALSQLGKLDEFAQEAARRGEKAAEEFGGAFNNRMQKVLGDGLKAIPPMHIDADSTDAERKLAEVQARMQALSSKQIGIDIDAGTAYAELRAIHAELQRLDRTSVNVAVRTNAHEAAAGMGQFIQQAEQAGRSTEKIGGSANFSMSRLGYLIALGASLGTSIVPAALAAAAAVGAIGTASIAGAAGLGVFALGVSGVADAVKALNGYEQDRLKSANSVNQAQRRMVGSADQVRAAETALANTRRSIADQAEDAARRIADAERNVADARRQAGRDAVAAARAVRDAQRGVTDAEEDARDVRRQLNEAIRDAVRDMAQLDVALGRNEQEQSKAITAQMEALEALNKLKSNPRATEVELRQARDAYNEQTQRLKELKQEQKELIEDRARAAKLGVEGDERVINARERVAEADQRIADAREKLDRAREDQQESEYQSARRIADAQRQLVDANRAAARQQRDAQYQLAQASRQVEQAQRSQAQAWEQTQVAGGSALEKLNEEMNKLSPAGQRFARFLFGLKDEVKGLRAAASEPLLPRLEEAITGLLPYLPALELFIGKVATKMGDLAIASVDALGNPVWQRFFTYVDQTAVPTLDGLYKVGENTAEGLISLYLALTPFDRPMGRGLVDLSEDFARWAAELNRSQGYRDFLEYVRENGPRVVHFLGEAGELLINLVQAAAPLGSLALRGITAFIEEINDLPLPALTALVFVIAAVSAAITVLGSVMRVVKFKQQLTDIFGPRMSRMVNTYAIETGRATEQTSRFGKATATASGIAAAAGNRLNFLGRAAGAVNTGFTTLARTTGGALARGYAAAGEAARQTAAMLSSRGGLVGALYATNLGAVNASKGAFRAGAEIRRFGYIGSRSATELGRLRAATADVTAALGARFTTVTSRAGQTLTDVTTAAGTLARTSMVSLGNAVADTAYEVNRRAGLAQGLRRTRSEIVGVSAAAEVAARQGLPQLRNSIRDAVSEFNASGGLEGAYRRTEGRLMRMATSVRESIRNAVSEFNATGGIEGAYRQTERRVIDLTAPLRAAVKDFKDSGGIEGAYRQAEGRIIRMGEAANTAARGGLSTLRTAFRETVIGSAGLDGAAGRSERRLGSLGVTAETTGRRGLLGLRANVRDAVAAFNDRGGMEGALDRTNQRIVGLAAAAEVAGRQGIARLGESMSRVTAVLTGPGAYNAAANTAVTRTKALGAAAGAAASKGFGALQHAGGSLMEAMGGPWGLALAAGTVLVAGITASMADWKAKTEGMQTVLQDLGHTYHDLAQEGKLGGTEAALALQGIVDKNPDMQRAATTLQDMGLGFDQMARAAAGSKPDVDAMLKVIDEAIDKTGDEWRDKSNFLFTVGSDEARDAAGRLATLRQMRQATLDNANALDIQERAQRAVTESSARYQAIQKFSTSGLVLNRNEVQKMAFAFDENAIKIQALTGLTKAFGDVQATGAQRADAMRAAIEATTGSTTAAIDADDLFASKLIALRDQVNGAKQSHDEHATSMDRNSATALRNRQAIKDTAGAVRDLYLEDIASGMPMDQATKKHGDRIKALKEEAHKLGLTSTETDILIGKYGEIDPKVKTVYTTEGFPKVYAELSRLKFMQDAVAKGWSVAKAEAAWKAQEWYKKGFQGPVFIPAKAEGGRITGPGTGTSDDVLMWGSNGEFMQQTKAVNYYGEPFMEALNERRIPKELLPGYATGGLVGDKSTKSGLPAYAKGGSVDWPFKIDVSKTPIMTLDEALAVIGGGPLGTGGGGQGWRWQMEVLRKQFPGLDLISGYRANSYTASGSLSWHSRDGGRAVDLPPRMDVFRFIHDTYGQKSKELIWGGNPDRNIYQGQHHRFDDALLYQHGPYKGKPGPSPHVHWAFDNGGQLLPGWNLVPNWTGQPEPVLSPSQWRTIEDFVVQGMAGGNGGDQLHFHFREAALDHGRLNALLDARDARARPGRPR